MKFAVEKLLACELEINGEKITAVDVITMRGLETAASCLGTPTDFTKAWMPYVALGQGEKAPSTEDMYLENEKHRKEGVVSQTSTKYTVVTTFQDFTESFILREVGLLNAVRGGVLGARWLLAEDIIINIGDVVNIICKIYIV